MADRQALNAAAFLTQALDLRDDPRALAPELMALERGPNAGIWSIELDSSVGPAAFLIYDYALTKTDASGTDGRARFETDRETMERAANLGTPGPRILAHAEAGDVAFILATTPAVHRALTGQAAPEELEATEANLLPGPETDRLRAESAEELLKLLRAANDQARTWLRAIRAEANVPTADASDRVEFNEAETELALFLLDERSIEHVLQALSLVVEAAKAQVADARQNPGRDPQA